MTRIRKLATSLIAAAVLFTFSIDTSGAGANDLTGTYRTLLELNKATSWGDSLELTQTGDKLSGSYKGNFGEGPITGVVNGHEFEIQFQFKVLTEKLTRWSRIKPGFKYTGTIDGDTIKGLVTTNHGYTGTFSGHASTATTTSEIFNELPSDIQKEVIAEQKRYEKKCNGYGQFAKFNHCDCLADLFLIRRIAAGSGKGAQAVELDLVKEQTRECINEPSVVEFHFAQCKTSFVKRVDDIVGYCECYSKEIGASYRKQQAKALTYVSGLAHKKCNMRNFGLL